MNNCAFRQLTQFMENVRVNGVDSAAATIEAAEHEPEMTADSSMFIYPVESRQGLRICKHCGCIYDTSSEIPW